MLHNCHYSSGYKLGRANQFYKINPKGYHFTNSHIDTVGGVQNYKTQSYLEFSFIFFPFLPQIICIHQGYTVMQKKIQWMPWNLPMFIQTYPENHPWLKTSTLFSSKIFPLNGEFHCFISNALASRLGFWTFDSAKVSYSRMRIGLLDWSQIQRQ